MGGIWQKEVGKRNIRKYALDILNLYKSEEKMSKQAKTLTSMEIRRVLDFIATRKHAVRTEPNFQSPPAAASPPNCDRLREECRNGRGQGGPLRRGCDGMGSRRRDTH